jgi:hypothetical protein
MPCARHWNKLAVNGPHCIHIGHATGAPLWSVFLVSFTVNKASPTLSPQGGRVLPANGGQDQRIVCACCRGLRPRLRSVSSRLTVCARLLALRARQADRSRGHRQRNSAEGTRPHAVGARQHAHTNNLTETDRSAQPNQTSRRQPPAINFLQEPPRAPFAPASSRLGARKCVVVKPFSADGSRNIYCATLADDRPL